MKFLIDAHLPGSLCALLARAGHDALHTRSLPDQNTTKDRVINHISVTEERVVISKDTDFFFSHLLQRRPWKLLLVRTGNISTRNLCGLFERHLSLIETELQRHTLVEIDRDSVRVVK